MKNWQVIAIEDEPILDDYDKYLKKLVRMKKSDPTVIRTEHERKFHQFTVEELMPKV